MFKYDPKFPLKFGAHVIVDERNGATYVSEKDDAIIALQEVLIELGMDHIDTLTQDEKIASAEFGLNLLESARTRKRPVFPDGIVRAGPMVTQDACKHEKTQELLYQRYLALARGEMRNDVDVELVGQLGLEEAEKAEEYYFRSSPEKDDPEELGGLGALSSLLGRLAGGPGSDATKDVMAEIARRVSSGEESGAFELDLETGAIRAVSLDALEKDQRKPTSH